MDTSPLKIQRGMARQLQVWREITSGSDHRLGWKVGFNLTADQQRLHLNSAMVGFLSDKHRLASGEHYPASPGAVLLAEPEIAVQIGCTIHEGATTAEANASIIAYTAALELVDTTRSVNDDMEEILAGNLFHERVLFAEPHLPAKEYAHEELMLSLRVNGSEVRTLEPERVPGDFSTVILDVANMLAAHGEQLRQGDWIITGAAARPTPIQAGDEIVLDMGQLGKVNLGIR